MPAFDDSNLSDRQKKILAEINRKKILKISDLFPIFKKTSVRTLRNDLNFLLEKKFIKKEGFNKSAVYKGV
jgi:DeoR/GlpR family transcriptional regulator of sugar metabolism